MSDTEMEELAERSVRQPTDALAIMELGHKLQVFRQMYLFMKCVDRYVPSPAGQMVICTVNDQHKVNLAVTGKMLYQALLPEFDQIGQSLDANGVDTTALLDQVDNQVNQMYGVTAK